MKLAADRQAECERLLQEAAEKKVAEAEGAALVAPGGSDAGGEGGSAAAGAPAPAALPAGKRKPKNAGAPKSRTELPSSGYHGVVRKSPNCFQCKTLVNQKVLFIGSFNTAESAARAYDVCMRDLASKGGVSREPSYNFPSDAVAEVAADLAEKEAELRLEGGSKRCTQCSKLMGVRLKVCRNCRQGSGPRSTYKGVRAKSGTAAVAAAAAGAGLVAAGDDEGMLLGPDGEAAAPAAVAPAKYQAFVWHDRVNEYIGTYHTEEEAALAYDVRYREVVGDAADPAKLNWPSLADGQAAVDAALRVRCAMRAFAHALLRSLPRSCPEHRIASLFSRRERRRRDRRLCRSGASAAPARRAPRGKASHQSPKSGAQNRRAATPAAAQTRPRRPRRRCTRAQMPPPWPRQQRRSCRCATYRRLRCRRRRPRWTSRRRRCSRRTSLPCWASTETCNAATR